MTGEFYELTRGVHRSVRDHAPGKVCDTFDELMQALKEQDYEFDKTCRFVSEILTIMTDMLQTESLTKSC